MNPTERPKIRNITPSFIRFKRKNVQENCERPPQQMIPTDRCSSKTSRNSFDSYERRVMQLSQLKKRLNPHREQDTKAILPSGTNLVAEELQHRRTGSNEKCYLNAQPIRTSPNRRKNSISGKNIVIKTHRTPSNERRTDDSLKKEEERAEKMNVQFLQNVLKNQAPPPNYLSKLKMKKVQRKSTAKSKLLNLTVPVSSAQELEKYEIYGELGQGAYGTVKMGILKSTGERIAVKIYEKRRIDEPNKVKNLERQINILGELDHPIIAKLIQVIETQLEVYIIMEYGGANSLYNYLLSKPDHRLQESEAKRLLLIIADALSYLHRKDIVHRDIKAENILINRHKELKLIDFGFSLRCPPGETIDTFCGTPTYMAPEIVSKIDHEPVYTDMWSLGILFYVMLQGNYPFRAKAETQLFEKIRKGQFQYIHDELSSESKKMIESLTRIDPKQRLTIEQVLSKTNREWLSTNVQ